jgi:CheY-like chemotaxis protein
VSLLQLNPVTEHRRVLVVDDDEDLRRVLLEALSTDGVAAYEACDGVDALDKIRAASPPCALVLDLDMPRLTGGGLVAELRADTALARIPVITMTAATAPLGLDTQGHLPKPFELDSLLGLLFQICRECAICDRESRAIGSIFSARCAADLGTSRGRT